MNEKHRLNLVNTTAIKLLLFAAFLFVSLLLTSCNPSLSLNPKYSYSSFDLEIGESIPDDISDYVDLTKMSKEDADFVRENTEILYDGDTAHDKTFDSAGTHTLVINYCGKQYRKYTITICDKEAPTIKALHNVYTFVGLELSDEQLDNLFEAEDNSGDVTLKITKPDVDYNTAGTYTVTAVAEDSSGNTSEASVDVVVQEPKYGAEGTYVFVSISKQHLTYFVDGKAVLDCPVVTGNIYNNHDTPKGTFSLIYKSRNVTLKGSEDNGDKYESFVNYWMAFIGASIGLHDATWRSSFGGEIYKGGGSHGCVNMPLQSAGELYEMLEPGTPVLVY